MMLVQCKECGASLDRLTYIQNITPDGRSFIVKIAPGHTCPSQDVEPKGLSITQKEEVSQMIMHALATGSV